MKDILWKREENQPHENFLHQHQFKKALIADR